MSDLLNPTCTALKATLNPPRTPSRPGSASLEHPEVASPTPEHWEWDIPDLQEGSPFHKAQLKRLKEVVQLLGGPEVWLQEGLTILEWHRSNYGAAGPTHLTVLW